MYFRCIQDVFDVFSKKCILSEYTEYSAKYTLLDELPVFKELFADVLHFAPMKSKLQAAQVVLSLLDDSDKMERSGINGKIHARKFKYQEVAQQELQLIEQLSSEN